ncbi:MAG: hypothetical protein HYX82_02720 [Chloroflexi bacterium]|nr:hypothetical protein [Chloroflexota bacterium]
MERFFRTKEEARKRIREWTAWAVAALIGVGVALSLSIIFLVGGVIFIAMGVAVGILGWGAAAVFPELLPYRRLRCPHCQKTSEVLPGVSSYECTKCARPVEARAATEVEPQPMWVGGSIIGRKLLVFFTALSYIAFFVEVYLGHYAHVLTLHWTPALIPVFFSPIALVIALVTGFWLKPMMVRIFNLTMLASIVMALSGTYFHITARPITLESLFSIMTWMGSPPFLAPFAFALPGIMGLVATYRIQWVPAEEKALEGELASVPTR